MSTRLFELLSDHVAPPNSNRRMLLRVMRDVMRHPRLLTHRLNAVNFRNFLTYRNYRFRCPVCGNLVTPLYDFPDVPLRHEHRIGVLRETLQCRSCLASMRHRSLAVALLDTLNERWSKRLTSIADLASHGLGELHILDSDNFSATSSLLARFASYTRCSYVPDKPWGSLLERGYYNEDLQHLTFDDETFDIVLTSDVMEHVRDCDAAHREIFRVLRGGGAYIFTVPYDDNSNEDLQLVDTTTPNDVFLCEPHIHGDPLTGGILAYRVFGRGLLSKLQALGFETSFLLLQKPANLIIKGDVFVARKPAAPRSQARVPGNSRLSTFM